jgi:hypothetical protein
MPNLNPNSTDYFHSYEPNTGDLTMAMDYNSKGEPAIRVLSNIQGDIIIEGEVNIPGTVTVNSSAADPINNHITEVGTSGILSTPYLPIGGTVTVNQPVAVTDNNGSLTVDGTVELGATTLSALENINAAVSGTVGIAGTVTTTPSNTVATQVSYATTPQNLQLDMVGRQRVAVQGNSWWYAPTVDKDGDLRYIESFTGAGATSQFVQNLASISVSSGTDTNGKAIRISRRRHKMRPGISIQALFSINWNGYDSGVVTKRCGVFTDFNGIFYEVTTDLAIVVRRRLIDNTIVEKRVLREDFNIDKLDGTQRYDLRPVPKYQAGITGYVSTTPVTIPGNGGTVYNVVFNVNDLSQFVVSRKYAVIGVSPATYNGTVMITAVSGTTGAGTVTATYITDPGVFVSVSNATLTHTALHNQYVFGFDFTGSRATTLRFFIDGPNGRYTIHQENFGSELSTPFANAPAMSTRYEVINNGSPAFRPSLLISSEVINVEAELELNPGFGVATNNTPLTFLKAGTAEYPIVGLALRAGEPYQRADLQIQSVNLADLNNFGNQNSVPATFYWRMVLNPTIGGTGIPASVNVGKCTRVWSYVATNTVSGGIDLISGYANSYTGVIDVRAALNFINLGSNIAYDDSDKIVLVVKQLKGGTNDAQIVASVNFIEAL